MSDRPDAAQLLSQARQTLLQEILPDLGENKRFLCLMIANAMAIAGRDFAADKAGPSEAAAALATYLARSDTAAAAGPEALRRLVEEIRKGDHDGDARLYRLLLEEVRERLARSNPKQLD